MFLCLALISSSNNPFLTILELCSVRRESCGDLYLQLSKHAAPNYQHALAVLFRVEMEKVTLCNISAIVDKNTHGPNPLFRPDKQAADRLTEVSSGDYFSDKQETKRGREKLAQPSQPCAYTATYRHTSVTTNLIFPPLSTGGKQMVSRS